MKTQQQSGSVIIFAIVGVVLALAVIGSIVLVQKRGGGQEINTDIANPFSTQEQEGRVDGDTPQSEAEKEQPEKQDDTKKDEQAKQEAADKKAAEEKKAKEEAAKEAKEKELAERAAEAERKRQQQAEANEDANVSPGPIARTGGGPQATDLPTTGPVEDAFAAVFGLIAIFGAGYVYYHYGRK